ncbi:MAG TPA: anti-sigma factor [Pseudonocardiaceae bacterium]|nr:anti-sigma factor [Pseudonocardiaceae bacterium]
MNPELHTLTGAYSLDAIDNSERGDFERHLAACPECAQEVAELRRTASRLGAAISEDPPGRLKQRVLEEIKRVRQDSPGGLRVVGSGGWARVGARRWVVGVTSVAAAVALALAGTFGVIALRAQHQLAGAQGALAQASGRYASVAQLLSEPDVRAVSSNGTNGGSATAIASRTLDKAILLTFHLPATPSNETYQAWAIGPGGAHSLGLLSGGSAVPVVLNGLAGTTKFGVTVEPAGGSKQRTTTPVILFDVPA